MAVRRGRASVWGPSAEFAPDILWTCAGGRSKLFGASAPFGASTIAGTAVGAGAIPIGTLPIVGSNWQLGTSDGAGTGDFTLLSYASPIAAATARVLVGFRTNVSLVQAMLYANFNGSTGAAESGQTGFFVYGDGGQAGRTIASSTNGDWHVIAGRRMGTDHSIWMDGVNRSSASQTVRDILTSGQKFGVGASYNGSDTVWTLPATEPIAIAAAWNRALNDAELRSIGQNPWLLFETQRRRIRVGSFDAAPTPIVMTWAL